MVKRSRAATAGSSKRARTGVTITPTTLYAADVRLPDGVWRAPLDPPPPENGYWPSLTSALADLARTLGVTGGTLAVSLVSPFTEVRRIEFPPVRDEDVQRLLSRGASRYFVSARAPQIVGASLAARRARGAPTSVIAAAASARLVAAIRHSAQQAGWTVETVAPAEGAWVAAALAIWPAFTRQSSVLVAHDDRTDLLQIGDGRLVAVRRFRGGGADAAMIADALGQGAPVGVVGSVAPRRELAGALASVGVTAKLPAGEWSNATECAESLAAQFAGSDLGPVLRGEDSLIVEQSRARTRTWQMAGVAAMLFVLAAAIELWGVHHQLALVRAERARIRPEIASTMVGRTTVDAAYRHLTTLNDVAQTAPRWSSVIASVSDALPDEAYLMALRTRDDSVIVDGLADHAARVFDALETAKGLTGVRAAAAVRRELQDDGTVALEHFTIAARVATPAPSTTLPASNTPPRGPNR